MGGEKKERDWGGRGTAECEEVMVSSKEGHVPDHLSPRKDISLLAPIVPLHAKTRRMSKAKSASQDLGSSRHRYLYRCGLASSSLHLVCQVMGLCVDLAILRGSRFRMDSSGLQPLCSFQRIRYLAVRGLFVHHAVMSIPPCTQFIPGHDSQLQNDRPLLKKKIGHFFLFTL